MRNKVFISLFIVTCILVTQISATHLVVSRDYTDISSNLNSYFYSLYENSKSPNIITDDLSAYHFIKNNLDSFTVNDSLLITDRTFFSKLTNDESFYLTDFINRVNNLIDCQAITLSSSLLIQINTNPTDTSTISPRNTTFSLMPETRNHANALHEVFMDALQFDGFTAQATAGAYFAERVKSGGIWDYKSRLGTYTSYYVEDLGTTMTGEDIGNFHYGYVGSAAFGSAVLKSSAGMYQIYSGTSNIRYWDSFFDDPRDQTYIQMGINRYTAEH